MSFIRWLTFLSKHFSNDSKNDIIFLIIEGFEFEGGYYNDRILGIYENVEEKGTIKWKHVETLELMRYNIMPLSFPPVIHPIADGKFIFFPTLSRLQEISRSNGTMNFDFIELWNKNYTLTRSSIKFPMDLRYNIEDAHYIWILQVWFCCYKTSIKYYKKILSRDFWGFFIK